MYRPDGELRVEDVFLLHVSLTLGRSVNRHAVDRHRPAQAHVLRHRYIAGQRVEQRRLARAGWPDDCQQPASNRCCVCLIFLKC